MRTHWSLRSSLHTHTHTHTHTHIYTHTHTYIKAFDVLVFPRSREERTGEAAQQGLLFGFFFLFVVDCFLKSGVGG